MKSFDVFDVIVLGGGIAGASAARALSIGNAGAGRTARRVLLIDAFDPGHDRGSSHGDGRIVRFTYPEAAYLAMAKLAYRAWADVERDAGVQLIETTGSWECGAADCPVLAQLEEGMQKAGIEVETLSPSESRRRFPQFSVGDDQRILYQQEGAVVRADAAVKTMWNLLVEAGGTVAPGHRVERIETSPGRPVEVFGQRADGSSFHFEGAALVVASGGWSADLLKPLGLDLPLHVTREVLGYFPVRPGQDGVLVDHRAGQMPTLIDYQGPDGSTVFYALPQIEVPGVKVGWHHSGPQTEASDAPEISETVLEGIKDYVGRRFPYLRPEPIQVTTCLYTNTPDYHFVLDRFEELPQIVIGTGFSGHGFKFGPVVGEILAQLTTGGEPPVNLDLFRSSRFQKGGLARRSGA